MISYIQGVNLARLAWINWRTPSLVDSNNSISTVKFGILHFTYRITGNVRILSHAHYISLALGPADVTGNRIGTEGLKPLMKILIKCTSLSVVDLRCA